MKETKYNSIEEMQKEKADFIDSAKKTNNYDGLHDILTEIYTISAHFIFELIQNAEDVEARKVCFTLYDDKLVFEHDGTRPFDLDDIDSITCIGNSTKKNEGNAIGKFGIGFKSVFAYTSTPEIHSGEYHFKIEDMAVPKVVKSIDRFDKSKTVIILPFDGKKDKRKCYEEIRNSFLNLKSTTLLFLQHINKIVCSFKSTEIKIVRTDSYKECFCPANVCELSLFENNVPKARSYYMRFFKQVHIKSDGENELKKIQIGIAFKMKKSSENDDWHINPILKKDPQKKESNIPDGQVFAYFPCEKEERKLCFHIHAPFALPPSRENLRDDEANNEVIREIGRLACESMKELKEDGLIDMNLYKTLPNNKDDLGKYADIGLMIADCFKNNPYILMADGTYSYAKDKCIGFQKIHTLLTDADLSIINDVEKHSFFVKNPSQNDQREDSFLQSLGIKRYGMSDFLIQLKELSFCVRSKILEEFEKRNIDWFQRLYELMDNYWSNIKDAWRQKDLCSLSLCYCMDKKLRPFDECCLIDKTFSSSFSHENSVNPELFSKPDLESFFERQLGVRKYSLNDEAVELCKAIQRNKSIRESFNSIHRLIKLCRVNPSVYETIGRYAILCSDDGIWDIPENFYLPEEFSEGVKNISIYYDFYNSRPKTYKKIHKLSLEYKCLFYDEKGFSQFMDFLFDIGVDSTIEILETSCRFNPNWRNIEKEAEGDPRGNCNPTDVDYKVAYFDEFLSMPRNEAVFELIWSFLVNNEPDKFAYCSYRKAAKYRIKRYNSQIVMALKNAAWVLQSFDGEIKYVKPDIASIGRIPPQYRGDSDDSWLQGWLVAIGFGEKERLQNEEQRQKNEFLKSMGYDPDLNNNLQELLSLGMSKEDLLSRLAGIKTEFSSSNEFDNDDFDSDSLMEKSLKNYAEAPEKKSEEKTRSVRVGISEIRSKSSAYLKGMYMDTKGDMNCQICNNPMPFMGLDGNAWFSNFQLFNTRLVPKNCEYNYVALCPVCSARMKVYFNENLQEKLYRQIGKYGSDTATSFKIHLDKEETISFSPKHITSLRSIVKKELESQLVSLQTDITEIEEKVFRNSPSLSYEIEENISSGCTSISKKFHAEMKKHRNENISTAEVRLSGDMAELSQFKIKQGLLERYIGKSPNAVIPAGVIKISENAFYNCKSLVSVTLPDSVKRICKEAFCNCTNLKSVTLSSCIREIEWGTFFDCSSLTELTIPNGVTEIAGDAFHDCSSLVWVDIPDSVNKIGSWAFVGCSSLCPEAKNRLSQLGYYGPF